MEMQRIVPWDISAVVFVLKRNTILFKHFKKSCGFEKQQNKDLTSSVERVGEKLMCRR